MRQLAYLSDAAASSGSSDLKAILDKARLNNRQAAVTGLLLFDGAQFLQVLEGEKADVAAIFKRILADRRHLKIRILSDREVARREFGNWAMAACDGDGEDDSFSAQVRALMRTVSCPSLRAKFQNFADYG